MALKKRYLHLRVERAAMTKTNLSEEEILSRLDQQRECLFSEMKNNADKIQSLKEAIRERKAQKHALKAIKDNKDAVCCKIAALEDTLKGLLSIDSPLGQSSDSTLSSAHLLVIYTGSVSNYRQRSKTWRMRRGLRCPET